MKDVAHDGGYLATVGMFDGYHRGHQWLVGQLREKAAEENLKPLVITFDSHPLSIIRPGAAPKLITSTADKLRMLGEACEGNVRLLPFDEATAKLDATSFLRKISADYGVSAFAMGFNNHIGSDRCDSRQAAALGIMPVFTFEHFPIGEVSSSKVRKTLSNGNVNLAARLLGRLYTLRGTVVGGKKLGRTIGFPTANIQPYDKNLLIPANGVYAVDVRIDGKGSIRRGMLNIGTRPTVDHDSGAERSIEVHILDFEGEIYGREIELSFIGRLRSEKSFENLEALAAQLAKDRKAAAAIPTQNL